MKHVRIIFFTILCISVFGPLTAASFSDWQIGPSVMIQPSELDEIDRALSFGIDGRFRYRSLSGSLMLLYCRDVCPQDHEGIRINAYPQLGAVATIEQFRVGAYAGPRLGYFFNTGNDDAHFFDVAFAFRFNGDVHFGPVTLGLFYLMEGRESLSTVTWDNWYTYFQDHRGRLGLSLLAMLR